MQSAHFILCIMALSNTNITNAQNLGDYQWKNRILLLIDKSFDTDALTSQFAVLTTDKKALTERDLLIFKVTPNSVATSEGTDIKFDPKKIYRDYDLKADFAGVVLLGKDGGVKLEEPFEIAAQKIFSLIDGMPMRKREMRDSN